MRIMKKETYYLIGSGNRSSRWIYLTFFCIIVFVLVFFPFYAINLRYQLSYIFGQIFDTIGWIALYIGAIMTLISILSIFTGGRNIRFHYLIVGVILLWVGSWCTGIVIEIFGITIGNETATGGYH